MKFPLLKNERGSASIEATIALVFFIFVVFGIYMLANFCIVQAKVANAVNATAKEMSQYSYFYHALNFDQKQKANKEKAQKAADAFEDLSGFIHSAQSATNDTFDQLQSHPDEFITQVLTEGGTDATKDLSGSINKLTDMFGEVKNNPTEFVRSMVAFGVNEGSVAGMSQLIAAPLAKAMCRQHFGDTKESANAYLESKGVDGGYDGINFSLSTVFVDGSDPSPKVQIVAYYRMTLENIIPNPALNQKITVCQKAVTDAWFGDA